MPVVLNDLGSRHVVEKTLHRVTATAAASLRHGMQRVLKNKLRPASVYLLMAVLLLQGLSGVSGGFVLVTDPTGSVLGMPVDLLHGSPFTDYLVPGFVLLVVLGVFPLIVVYGLWARRSWSWRAALLVGLALIVWIGVEILIIGYSSWPPLQLIYGLLGFVNLVLVMLPSVRRYLGVEERGA